MDVGSNLGGFLFYLEQFGEFSQLLGIEGDRRFTDECQKVIDLLNSNVKFIHKGVMEVEEFEPLYDTMIFQNIYHYVYDKEASHEKIFKKLSQMARSIIWYNPMTAKDPVIAQHAKSNREADWGQFNHEQILIGAIKSGYLHPIRDRISKFGREGDVREHWLFIRDETVPIEKKFIPISEVNGAPVKIADHYLGIHEVRMDDERAYKIFNREHLRLAENVAALVDKGVIDTILCPDLRFILNEDGRVIGYSQPRGLEISPTLLGSEASKVDNDLNMLRLILFSRMLRYDVFCHDLGAHNFVCIPDRKRPMLIDLENFVLDASTKKALSIYRRRPDDNEYRSAESNLRLFFGEAATAIRTINSIAALSKLLYETSFLNRIDVEGALEL